jgi:hypothetical protein
LVEGFVVSIVGRVLMHEAPASLDRIEVRTIGRDEVQHALTSLSLEPSSHATTATATLSIRSRFRSQIFRLRKSASTTATKPSCCRASIDRGRGHPKDGLFAARGPRGKVRFERV